jgi:hypothetical protein
MSGSLPCAGKRRPSPGAGEDGLQQRRRIEVALPLDYQPIAKGRPIADPPADGPPRERAAERHLDVGAFSTNCEAFYLPVQVGDEREQRPGEPFPEGLVANKGRQLGLDEPDLRVLLRLAAAHF